MDGAASEGCAPCLVVMHTTNASARCKAVIALREAAAREPSGPAYVRLAHVLALLGKRDDALHAPQQALYCFRHNGACGKGRTVALLILRLDPADPTARKRAA